MIYKAGWIRLFYSWKPVLIISLFQPISVGNSSFLSLPSWTTLLIVLCIHMVRRLYPILSYLFSSCHLCYIRNAANRVRKTCEPVNRVLGTQRSKLRTIERLRPNYLEGADIGKRPKNVQFHMHKTQNHKWPDSRFVEPKTTFPDSGTNDYFPMRR